MKKYFFIMAMLFLAGCSAPAVRFGPVVEVKSYPTASSTPQSINRTYMNITSSDFNNGDFMPADLSCLGEGRAPLLRIAAAPTSTAAFAIIVDDPDAPGGVFTHWLIWNIDKATENLDGKKPPAKAVTGINSAGAAKYALPCPPSGVHHYYYRLYALDQKLNLPAGSDAKQLLKAMTGHIIDEAVLMGKVAGKK